MEWIKELNFFILLVCKLVRFSPLLATSFKMSFITWNSSEGAFSRIIFLSFLLLVTSFLRIYLCCLSRFFCFKDKRWESMTTNQLPLWALPEFLVQNSKQWTLWLDGKFLNRHWLSSLHFFHRKFDELEYLSAWNVVDCGIRQNNGY